MILYSPHLAVRIAAVHSDVDDEHAVGPAAFGIHLGRRDGPFLVALRQHRHDLLRVCDRHRGQPGHKGPTRTPPDLKILLGVGSAQMQA